MKMEEPNRDMVKELQGIIPQDLKVVEVLCQKGSDEFDNFIGKLDAVEVRTTNVEGLPISLHYIIKTVPRGRDSYVRDLLAFEKEANMYGLVIPQLKEMGDRIGLHSPKCFFSSDSSGVIIMENLKVQGFTMMQSRFGMKTQHITWAMDEFARLHAYSHVLMASDKGRQVSEAMKLKSTINYSTVRAFFESMYRGQVRALRAIGRGDLGDRFEALIPCAESVIEHAFMYNESEFPALNHGDGWTNNFMFKPDEQGGGVSEGILLDWQFIVYGSPATDLSLFFGLSVPPKDRERMEKEFLGSYHERLCFHGRALGLDVASQYPFATLCKEYKQRFAYSYFIGAHMLPIFFLKKDIQNGGSHSSERKIFNWEEFSLELVKESPEFKQTLIDFHENAVARGLI